VTRVHPIHILTLAVAVLAAVFAFVAMRVAFDARDAAWSAAAGRDGDNWYEINELQTALIRAGVIEDPSVIPDDHGRPDGPWARCLTEDEREGLGLDPDEVPLASACDTIEVAREERCPDPVPAPDPDPDVDEVFDDVPGCTQVFVVGSRRFEAEGFERVHPFDVDAEAEEWSRAAGDPEVDRVARGPDATFVHVVGEGWLRLLTW
jgi:hypothetical protein